MSPITDPVVIAHDGRKIRAQRGEPVAVSLLAAGRLLLARSPKLHRPRGPFCLRAACDGCLARVDGEPNIMTCQVRAEDGMRIETQNVLGSRGADLLRATDYVFPQGFDHHRLMAGTPVLGAAMQQIARRVAGLGRMPEREDSDAASSEHGAAGQLQGSPLLTPDVLIVGAGRSGALVAMRLKQRAPELKLLLVDSAPQAGGRHALCDPEAWQPLAALLKEASVEVELESCVVGLYLKPEQALEPTALLSTYPHGSIEPPQLRVVRPRAVVLAVGGHDYVPMFEANDLPGIFSARAALHALRLGVLVGHQIVLVGESPELHAFRAAAASVAQLTQVNEECMLRATGSARVSGALINVDGKTQALNADAIVVGGPRAPAFELAVQAGLAVRYQGDLGYIPIPHGYQCHDAGEGDVGEGDAAAEGSHPRTPPVFLAGSIWRKARDADDDPGSVPRTTNYDLVSAILSSLAAAPRVGGGG